MYTLNVKGLEFNLQHKTIKKKTNTLFQICLKFVSYLLAPSFKKTEFTFHNFTMFGGHSVKWLVYQHIKTKCRLTRTPAHNPKLR